MSPDLTPSERAARRRRLAEVFGDTLPEQTRDDTDEVAADAEVRDRADQRLLREVPPHHGS